MLDTVFMRVLDMSKTASIAILVILAARLLLKKAPKLVSYALWAVVLFRLLCPVSIEAAVSLLPDLEPVSEHYTLADEPISVAGAGIAAYRAAGDALNGGLGLQHIPTTERNGSGNVAYVNSLWWEVWILFGQYVWLAGMAVMLGYSVLSYHRTKRALVGAVPLRDNICLADEITSPFVLGLFRPKIYLPSAMEERERSYILLHEQHHIRRLDHVTRALSYLALCLHWFNPLVWLAFVLSGRDMEMSCDEAVVRELGPDIRADYSASLLSLATGRRVLPGTPLAFGEGDPGGRIRNLSRWKKPALWTVALAVIACAALALCLITDPKSPAAQTDGTPDHAQPLSGASDQQLSGTDGGTDTEQPDPPAEVDNEILLLTPDTAGAFIAETLRTFSVADGRTASFTLPEAIPADPAGETGLYITMSSTYVEGIGSYSVTRHLDMAGGWTGGETFTTAALDQAEGQLHEVFLRVAFMTEVGENQYREYSAGHVTLTAPFTDVPAGQPQAEVTADGQRLSIRYTTAAGASFTLSLTLPEGFSAGEPSRADLAELPSLPLLQEGEAVGHLVLMGYGATDRATLEAVVDPSAPEVPMPVYSPVALSNHVDYHSSYRPVASDETSCSAVAHPVSSDGATFDCVLAYDLASEPFFLLLTLDAGTLSGDALIALAQSVAFSP